MVNTPNPIDMPLKIGVMGGAGDNIPQAHLDKAVLLGEAIADAGCVIITGGCPGLPLATACGAKDRGGMVIGISPGLSLDKHAYKYGSPTLAHDVLIFTGSGLMGREVVNIRSSDIVVFIGGSTGTLGELAIAYGEGKVIGVVTGTGDISDMVQDILEACNKETGARVLYDNNSPQLVEKLLEVYRSEHYRRPSVFLVANAILRLYPRKADSRTLSAGCGLPVVMPQPGDLQSRWARHFAFHVAGMCRTGPVGGTDGVRDVERGFWVRSKKSPRILCRQK